MAERRMFTQKITESDAFLEMPMSSQALYFHLCMNADDDGFVKNPKSIQRTVGCNDDDLKLLIAKRFILPFDTGVIVIKHWRMHNLLRKDRYKETVYIDEKSMLYLKQDGAYTFDETQGKPIPKIAEISSESESGNQMATKWQPNGNRLAPQDSIGKDSIGSIVVNTNSNTQKNNKLFIVPTLAEVQAYCEDRGNSVDAQHFIDYYTSNGWKVGRNAMKDWKAAVRTWERQPLSANGKSSVKASQGGNAGNQSQSKPVVDGSLYKII